MAWFIHQRRQRIIDTEFRSLSPDSFPDWTLVDETSGRSVVNVMTPHCLDLRQLHLVSLSEFVDAVDQMSLKGRYHLKNVREMRFENEADAIFVALAFQLSFNSPAE